MFGLSCRPFAISAVSAVGAASVSRRSMDRAAGADHSSERKIVGENAPRAALGRSRWRRALAAGLALSSRKAGLAGGPARWRGWRGGQSPASWRSRLGAQGLGRRGLASLAPDDREARGQRRRERHARLVPCGGEAGLRVCRLWQPLPRDAGDRARALGHCQGVQPRLAVRPCAEPLGGVRPRSRGYPARGGERQLDARARAEAPRRTTRVSGAPGVQIHAKLVRIGSTPNDRGRI